MGFRNDSGRILLDIDECSRGTHTCKPGAERCFNYGGGFSCRCNSGFRYTSQSKSCEGMYFLVNIWRIILVNIWQIILVNIWQIILVFIFVKLVSDFECKLTGIL